VHLFRSQLLEIGVVYAIMVVPSAAATEPCSISKAMLSHLRRLAAFSLLPSSAAKAL
jgi:hypothetical protein